MGMEPITIVFGIIILILSVIVHEISHGYVALMLGDPTAKLAGRLTLNPISHLDPVGSFIVPLITLMLSGFVIGWAKPVPYNPYNLKGGKWGPAMVALAGPLSNFVIAAIFAAVLRFGVPAGAVSGSFAGLAMMIVAVNISLGVLNLIPIAPIDGSKVLFAILPPQLRFVEEFIRRYQLILILALLFIGLDWLGTPINSLIKLFLGLG